MIFSLRADKIGATASLLCILHCLLAPCYFFLINSSDICCSESPIWWQVLDYIFLTVSLLAIYNISRHQKNWLVVLLWISWVSLLVFFINEKVMFLDVSKYLIYIPALCLIILHLYNLNRQGTNRKCCHSSIDAS